MSTKTFLPMINSDVYNETSTSRPRKTSILTKIFSAILFIGLLFGSTMLGISVKNVGTNQVGYYDSLPGVYTSGVYFQFPWMEEMKTLDVGRRYTKLDRLIGSIADGRTFNVQNANVAYEVYNVENFVNEYKKSPKLCDSEIENTVSESIAKTLEAEPRTDYFEIPKCGINITDITFSKPLIEEVSGRPFSIELTTASSEATTPTQSSIEKKEEPQEEETTSTTQQSPIVVEDEETIHIIAEGTRSVNISNKTFEIDNML